MKILLVEDSRSDLLMLRRALEPIAKEVVMATSAAEARERLQEARDYDCILLDYHLPDENAPAILSYMRETGRCYPAVMLLSRADDAMLISRCIQEGAKNYFPKDKIVTDRRSFFHCIHDTVRQEYFDTKTHIDDLVDRLKKSNEELAQFAYVASHDLKAPLRAVHNLATWIEEDYAKGKDISEHVRMLKPKVERMDALINGLLEYSRIGRMHTDNDLVNTEELVREVIEDIDNGNGRVKVVGRLPPVRYNRTRLFQVFANLISNALKHNPDTLGARVEVSSTDRCHNPNCDFCARKHHSRNDMVTFSVKDNGPGIDPKYHKKVWEIFQTLKPKDDAAATGIGLSIVKRVVEENDGSVWLESQPGQGATFSFSVPK